MIELEFRRECKISNIQFHFTVFDLPQGIGTCKSRMYYNFTFRMFTGSVKSCSHKGPIW
jgi:hypothetical protein